jgi:hypothetical protein
MANGDNAATGGVMVILGIILAVAIGFFLFKSGAIGNSQPDVSIEMPDVNITNPDK